MVILTDERVDRISIKEKLLLDDIHIDWPYQPLLDLMPVFSEMNQKYLTRSDKIAQKHLCLPLHLGISKNDADFIANIGEKAAVLCRTTFFFSKIFL